MRRIALILIASVGLIPGCAKFPPGPPGGGGKRLHFRIWLDGPVNPNYVYIVAIRDGDDLTGSGGGPIPVVRPPWGNGFCAGKATHFVRYDGFQINGYALFQFTDLQNLLTYVQIGVPVNYVIPGPTDALLDFEIDLAQLRPPPLNPNDIQALQVNLMTMDRVPTDPHDPNPKFWDALGDSRDPSSIDDYITINVTVDRTYRNSDTNIEIRGDAPSPDLDIVDWTIQIRSL